MKIRPPVVPAFIVSALVPAPVSEYLLGDLEEQFANDVSSRGRGRARRAYWRRAIAAAWHARSVPQPREPRHRSLTMSHVWRDVLLGVRTAVRSPGYSAIAIVTLALAIGANTLLFSIANPLLVRPLPVKDPDTLGWVATANPARGIMARGRASAPDLLEWRAASKSFSQIAAYGVRESTLTGLGDAERIQNACATASLGDVWGLTPVAGRGIQPADEEPDRETAAVLGHRFWRERFNASPDAVGRKIIIDGKPAVIVGVMKPEIEIGNLASIDVWTPLTLDAASPRDERKLRVVGRLKPGVTVAAADAELRTISAGQAREHQDTNDGWTATVTSTLDALASPATWVILGLLGIVVLFVLIIACVNLANLVLARTVARRHDFAVQAALGASCIQLIRPLLCESLILSLAGALAGLGLAQTGLRAINAAASEQFLRAVSIDTNVLVFTAIMAVLTPLLFSLWPAWSAGRAPAVEAIRESRGSAGRQSGRRRSVLIASQVALALSLLVVSGLVIQSMQYIFHVDIGVDVSKLVTYRFELPAEKYGARDQQARFAEDLARDLAAIPNATGATVISHVPLFEGDVRRRLSGTLKDGSAEDERPWASWFGVSPDFFRTAGMPLFAGRGFESSDREGSQPVAILNRYAAEKYFDSIPAALGRTIVISGGTTGDRPVTIVGVAKGTPNAVNWTLSDPQIYVPFGQWPARAMSVFIRSDAGIEMSNVRAVMRRTDPSVAVANLKTMGQVLEEDLSSGVIINGLFIGFAALALALAAAGLYGVISYSVGQRRREFGVRLALGAPPSAIRRMVLGEGLRVVGIGAAIGLAMAAGLAYAARSLLYGISASDPLTFVAVTGAVLLVGVGAMWAPAARAMRVDPVKTLKAE